MHEKIKEELKVIAEEILRDEQNDHLPEIKRKIIRLYEALILAEYLQKQSELPSEFENEAVPEVKFELTDEVEKTTLEVSEIDFEPQTEEESKFGEDDEPLFIPKFDDVIEDFTLKKEFQDAFSLDDAEKLLEAKPEKAKQLSLHDKLSSNRILVGLNDRIAFVNNLFNFSQSDFNKVLQFLNECKTKDEAIQYIQYNVKPKYNWKGKEELEERLMILIERKFI